MSTENSDENNNIRVLNEFKNSLIAFFDELISQFPEESDLIVCRIRLASQIPIKDVIDEFNLKMCDDQIKSLVVERNESFFLDDVMFADKLEKITVDHFKLLWRSGRLDSEDKELVWRWMDSFIYLADKYTKVLIN